MSDMVWKSMFDFLFYIYVFPARIEIDACINCFRIASEDFWDDELENAVTNGGINSTGSNMIKMRNIQHHNDEEDDDTVEELDEDLFQWAEQNLGGVSVNAGGGVIEGREEDDRERGIMTRDASDANLLSPLETEIQKIN
jgi:hypothetical protein